MHTLIHTLTSSRWLFLTVMLLLMASLTSGGCSCDEESSSDPTSNQTVEDTGVEGGDTSDNTDTSTSTDTSDNTDPDMPDCTAGTEGCPCDANGMCGATLVCDANICIKAPTAGFSISSAQARSCELLIEDGTEGRLLSANFADGVKGQTVRRPPRTALAFMRTDDTPFPTNSVLLQFDGTVDGLSVQEVRCFDRLGQRIDNVAITLE